MKRLFIMVIFILLWCIQPVDNLFAQDIQGEEVSQMTFDDSLDPIGASLDMGLATADEGPFGKISGKGTPGTSKGLIRFAEAEKRDEFPDEVPQESIADPLEPLNRVFFQFNDKLYFWLIKPMATGYKAVTPQILRVSIKNFFYNLAFPIRFINCFLQGKFQAMGDEVVRFLLNTSVFAGLFDPASSALNLPKHDEDFGQTLGVYGFGTGFYINWPVLGPSSVRGSFGLGGDYFLNPESYIDPTLDEYAVKAGDAFNTISLQIGDYEDLKKSALDPYIAVRDAYYQYRKKKIEE